MTPVTPPAARLIRDPSALSAASARTRSRRRRCSMLRRPRQDRRARIDGRRRLLEEKCREFSVEGSVVQIHPGPVVTTFELKPDAGVKYSKVTGLSDDLCLAMQAESVLIDRIPGKSTVGIQIPNPNREAISLRELLESDAYSVVARSWRSRSARRFTASRTSRTWRPCLTC